LTQVLAFVAAHWIALTVLVAVVIVLCVAEVRWVRDRRPADGVGNGITIGQPKAFDNRSLALRVERLSAGLETLKVINEGVTEHIGDIQGRTSTETKASFSVGVKGSSGKAKSEAGNKAPAAASKQSAPAAADAPSADHKPSVGITAGDVLNDRLNLASQIFNLQLLYERSLSDRMIEDQSRLQTVLGFQISITPPSDYEDCAAITEVAVRMQGDGAHPAVPVSLVALMPQEKTYNAESISSSERSIEGSAVAKVLTMGFSGSKGTRQLFVHRDSDTVAFERAAREGSGLLENAAVFGWEFRPVLGRRTVSAGTRQMLAVIAVPVADGRNPAESTLEICTRSYWRRYDRKRQTSAPHWSWIPWRVDRSATVTSAPTLLNIPNTSKTQATLAPKVEQIASVNSGAARATVSVEGNNFFSGTKVLIGGSTYREDDGTLTLKSDQVLEFETTVDALATGDTVLSGRYGSSCRLTVPKATLPVTSLAISRAIIRPLRKSKAFRLSIDIVGQDDSGMPKDFTLAALERLPDPILFVGSEAVAMPYDYAERTAEPNAVQLPSGAGGAGAVVPSNAKYLRVEAWISAKTLARSPSVSFRVPFCGLDYQASQPLSFSEPTAVRMGSDPAQTVFRIFYPQGFSGSASGSSLSIELDQTYSEGNPALQKMTESEYRLTVPSDIVSRYQNMVIRIGTAEPYLIAVPREDKAPPKPTVDANAKPPQIARGGRGPLEWVGTALDAITDVAIVGSTPAAAASITRISQQFAAYAGGTRLLVYLSPGATASEGQITLECSTAFDDRLTLQAFVTAP